MDKMSLVLQKLELENSKKMYKQSKENSFALRSRKEPKNNNLIQLSHNKNKLKTLCESLCKPVFVSITQLTLTELKTWCKTNPCKVQAKKKSIQKRKQRSRKFKNGQLHVKPQNVSFHAKTRSKNNKMLIKTLIKDVNQPYVKLYKIDTVTNRITQSFAKVISTDEHGQTQDTIHKAIYHSDNNSNDSVNVSNDLCNKNSEVTKRCRLSLPEKVTEINIMNKGDNAITTEEDLILQTKTFANVLNVINVSAELSDSSNKENECMKENINVLQKSSTIMENMLIKHESNVNVDTNIEEGNTPNCIPSELNSICCTQDNIFTEVKNDDFMKTEELIVRSENIEESTKESSTLDKNFIQKYKLFKELRVFLIKLESIKEFNSCSAAEVEQLTRLYHSNILPQPPVLFNYTKSLVEKNNERIIDKRQPNLVSSENFRVVSKESKRSTECISRICKTPNKTTCDTSTTKVLSTSEPLLNSSMKSSPTMNKKIQQEGSLESQKLCHNLIKNIKDCSKERSEQDAVSDTQQNSATKSILAILLQQSTNQTPELPDLTEKSLEANTVTEYKNKMLSLQNEMERKRIKQNVSEDINLKSFLSNQTEELIASGRKSPETCKNTVNITHPNLSTRDSASEAYPVELNKQLDNKKNNTIIYKCITCNMSFENYSNLQQHLTIHVQKQNDTPSASLIDSNVPSQDSQQIISDLSKSKTSKSSHISKQKSSVEILKRSETEVDVPQAIQESLEVVSDGKESMVVQKSGKTQFAQNPKISIVEPPTLIQNNSESTLCFSGAKSEKMKSNKVESSKKSFSICECHNKPGASGNCLQIEIVLLCHTCRILFRTMECFQTHYNVPEYVACKQNRLYNSRSPNLFCATCGMVFSSVQDVRHHLEIHDRFKKLCTMEFRCNICKIIFVGIGSLFYIHWSNHASNPFWIADEKSFPTYSVVKSKSRNIEQSPKENVKTSTISMEDYIQIAEYACLNCKLYFVTEDNLKKHMQNCKATKTSENTSVVKSSNDAVQKQVLKTIRIICSLCNNVFTEKTEFYRHIKDKHNFTHPKFMHVLLTPAREFFICTVCMERVEMFDECENHWLKHNNTSIFFTCMCCKSIYYNNLNSFLEHIKTHTVKTGELLSCTVNYGRHDSTQPSRKRKHRDKVTDQESSTSASNVNHTSSFTVLKRLILDTQADKSLLTKTQTTENTEASVTKLNTNNDKEKSNEVPEYDSEHELIIDLADSNDHNEVSKEEECRKKQTASNVPDRSSTDQTNLISKNDINSILITTDNIQESSQDVVMSESSLCSVTQTEAPPVSEKIITLPASFEVTVSSQQTFINDPQSFHASLNSVSECSEQVSAQTTVMQKNLEVLAIEDVKSVQNNKEINNTVPVVSQKETTTAKTSLTPKKQSPPKPRRGFLRVKPLAELMGSSHISQVCGYTVENADDLAKHPANHDSSNSVHKATEKKRPGKETIDITTNVDNSQTLLQSDARFLGSQPNPNTHNPQLHSVNLNVQSSEQQIGQLTIRGMTKQQPQKLQMDMNQNGQLPSLQKVTSAYHKNLPSCNITRTTTALPRYPVLKVGNKEFKIIGKNNIANAQNVQGESTSNVTGDDKQLSFFITIKDLSNNQSKYKCMYCKFSSTNISQCLMHELPGNQFTCKMQHMQRRYANTKNQELQSIRGLSSVNAVNQIQNNLGPKRFQQSTVNQSGIQCASSPVCYQYPYYATENSTNGNQMFKQNQKMIINQPVTGNALPTSFYYKNSNNFNGGMSIVINQAAPNLHDVPAIGILQQMPQKQLPQQQMSQQQMYQSQMYNQPVNVMNTSYMQQPQNVVNFSKPNNVYQVTFNQYGVSSEGETAGLCGVGMQPTSFICSHCSKTFVSEELLEMHTNSDHNFICEICNLRLYSVNDFNIHRIKHYLNNV